MDSKTKNGKQVLTGNILTCVCFRPAAGAVARLPASGVSIGTTIEAIRTTLLASARPAALSSNLKRDSGVTGICYPALSEISGSLFLVGIPKIRGKYKK